MMTDQRLRFRTVLLSLLLLSLSGLPVGAAPVSSSPLETEFLKLASSDLQPGDAFGWAGALSGDTLVIGAHHEDGGDGGPLPNSGAVYVFERNLGGPDQWGQAARLTASDAQVDDFFGASVAIDGDTLVVGAWGEDGGPGDPQGNAGAAYVFERNLGGPNAWGESDRIQAAEFEGGDRFGYSVAISGDTIVVGAYGDDGDPKFIIENAGAAHIFERDLGGPGAWGYADKLGASGPVDNDFFGFDVAISGDRIVIGAIEDDGFQLGDAGAAYVFEPEASNPNDWSETALLRASDAQVSDFMGWSVAIDGDTVVVGAQREDGGPGDPMPDAGAVYVFEFDDTEHGGWTETARLSAGNAQANDRFGYSVGVDGDLIVVGAWGEDGGPGDPIEDAGQAYVFERDLSGPGNWGESAALTASDPQQEDEFGRHVAIGGNWVAAGAWLEDGGPGDPLLDAGAVYLFRIEETIEKIYLPLIIHPVE